MKNQRFMQALSCQNNSRPPVWLMRQAGRYMPEYRAIREKRSFMEMCFQPEVAAEVTLLPIKLLDVDAAILFSDILLIIESFGLGVTFVEGKGPVIKRPLKTIADIERLTTPNISESLNPVFQAIEILNKELEVPLIGFCGGPFTVASYMIEGGSSKDLKKTKQWMMKDPLSFERLIDKVTESTITYLNHQIDAGVQALQIFDSWVNVLSYSYFRKYSLNPLEKILKGLKNPDIPVILFCRGSSVFAKDLASINPRGVSLDWNVDLPSLRQNIPSSIALQGNLDPDILYAPKNVIEEEVKTLLKEMKNDQGYIFNLGHGVKPDMTVDAVKVLVDTVKSGV